MDLPPVARAGKANRGVPLIVNADDFGFFDGVSHGILDAIDAGIVTATGVMANGPALDRWLERLKATPRVSVGVHLNATLGAPLTSEISDAFGPSGGCLPPRNQLVSRLISRRLSPRIILAEWRAQVMHCLERGLRIEFLNSHEHIHFFPGLYPGVRRLADEFGIRNVRAPRPEWGRPLTLAALLRNAVMTGANLVLQRPLAPEPALIGVARSGVLDLAYFRWRLPRLTPGCAYELMCHPGHSDAVARAEPQLSAYHDWDGELTALMSPTLADLMRQNSVRPVTYAELSRL